MTNSIIRQFVADSRPNSQSPKMTIMSACAQARVPRRGCPSAGHWTKINGVAVGVDGHSAAAVATLLIRLLLQLPPPPPVAPAARVAAPALHAAVPAQSCSCCSCSHSAPILLLLLKTLISMLQLPRAARLCCCNFRQCMQPLRLLQLLSCNKFTKC